MDPHAEFLELGDGRAHVHGVAAEPVELGHDEDVARLEPVEQAGEPAALPDRGGAETVSVTRRRGSMVKPAAWISVSWLSVVWPGVETRR